MKKLLVILMVMSVILCLGACSEDNAQDAQNSKQDSTENSATQSENTDNKEVYIVGFDNTFAPMGFEQDGENMGFDIDLAAKVAEEMNVEFKFQPIDWTLKETELNSNNIDMIWNGYSVTDERKQKVLFSEPYMTNRVLLLVNKDSGISSKADLKGKIACTQDQSSSLNALNKDDISKELKEIVTYASYNDVFNDLITGRCDVVVVDETMGLYYLSTSGNTDKFNVLAEDLGSEDYAIGFRKEDTELVDRFNVALKKLKEDGEIEKIYQKWFK